MKRIITLFLLLTIGNVSKSQIIINEIYGGGGNTGAIWNRDVVQIKNIGASAETLTGWAIQYASASGNSWNVDPIPTVTIQPGEFLNVMLASGGANGTEPPMPNIQADASPGAQINLGGVQGKLALTSNLTALTGTACPVSAVDYVGYGSSGQTCGPHTTGNTSGSGATQGYIRTNTDVPGSFDVNQSPLPVKLSKFEVLLKEKKVVLRWTTLSEINNSHFILSHSTDGRRFMEIGKINGNGNSSEEIHYEFIHESPVSGVNYYQLTQIDFDGRSEIFEVKWVKMDKSSDIKIYPFHVNNDLFIDGGQGEMVEIYNVFGSLVLNQKVDYRIDMSSFPSGIYLIKLDQITQKIFKQ